MAKNSLVINCDFRETRVALIEDGVIAELQIERAAARGTVGNIVLGRVTRVLPGMQAAFIDVGMERAAFLHVEDLIRPRDFEAYLAGDAREEERPGPRAKDGDEEDDEAEPVSFRPSDQAAGATAGGDEGDEEDDEGDEEDDESADGADDDEDEPLAEVDGEELADDDDDDDLLDDDDDDDDLDEDDDASDDEAAEEGAGEGEPLDDDAGDDDDDDDLLDDDDDDDEDDDIDEDEPGDAVGDKDDLDVTSERESDEVEGITERPSRPARAPRVRQPIERSDDSSSPPPDDSPDEPEEEEEEEEDGAAGVSPSQARRRRRARRRGGEGRQKNKSQAATGTGDSDKRARGERRRSTRRPGRNDRPHTNGKHELHRKNSARVSRSVPITEVVKEGDEVIVQVSKEPIGTKGARVTSHISLPGRYTVYLPTVEHLGISKRIGSARERARLRQVIETLKPPRGGLIVRTVAENLTKKSLKADIGYLVKLWGEVSRRREKAKSPEILYAELDLVLKTARDLFTEDIEKIVIDDREQHARLVRFIEMFMPERAKDVELYQGKEPIFDAYGIEDEIGRALSRKVPLPSGGHLIIDQAEALTAIDVNTGRYVGKGSKDLEETALKTNLEAVDEIAYQLRFRNIGGLVILDLIDMDVPANRDKVWRALEHGLAKDKAKTTLDRISDLGLIEMTRKRTRESLTRTMHETCFYCDGTGQIQSRATISFEILRQIRRERDTLTGYSVIVRAHPAVVDWMTHEEKDAVREAERRYARRIEFQPRREYHIEQFDLQGK